MQVLRQSVLLLTILLFLQEMNICVGGSFDENRKFTCTPAMNSCRTSFIRKQWMAAQAEVGITKPFTDHRDDVVRSITAYRNNVLFFQAPNAVPVFYAGILKCASETLDLNMRRKFSKPGEFGFDDQVSKFREDAANKVRYAAYANDEFLQTFAFVRDPLQRFYSGMAEVFFRTLKYGLKYAYTLKEMEKFSMEKHLTTFPSALSM